MEAAIQTLVKVFLKSSKGKENLPQKDFQNLVTSQLSNILSGSDSKEAVNNLAAGLDENQDGKLGFPEYMKLIGYLAVSLSDQRSKAKEEPNQNATGQVAQSSPEEKNEVNAEVKAEVKPEPTTEVKEAVPAETPSLELNVEPPKADVKGEAEAPKEENTESVNTTKSIVATVVVKEIVNGEVTEVTEVKEGKEVTEEVKDGVKDGVKEVTEITEELKDRVVSGITVKAEEVPAAEEKKEETAS